MRKFIVLALLVAQIHSIKTHKKSSQKQKIEEDLDKEDNELEDMQLLSQDGIDKLLQYGTNAEGTLVQLKNL